MALAAAVGVAALLAVPFVLRSPSNDRVWAHDQARLPVVEVVGGVARIQGMRDFRYGPDGSVEEGYRDEAFRLDEARRVWFVLAPFASRHRALAHSFLSFEFEGNRFVSISVEARREADESYSLVGGVLRGFEITYVIGTEEDLLGVRALRGDTLFLYPAVAGPEQVRALFVDMLERARQTQREPEFYNTVFNNCTTNLRDHVNRITPGRLPWGWGVLLPGFSDALALQHGLLDAGPALEDARRRFRADPRIREALDGGRADFSRFIREGGGS